MTPASSGQPTRLIHPFAPTTRSDFCEIVRGEGAWVFDKAGNRYIDALASLWYCNVGHGRSDIARAMSDQASTLAGYHVFEKFTNTPADQLAERLGDISPLPDARVFFTDSGSEAVDTAMKLAYLAQERRDPGERAIFISMTNSYHGMAYGGSSMGGIEANRIGFGHMMPDTIRIPRNDPSAAERAFVENRGSVVAVFIEPVSGSGGVVPADDEFLVTLRKLCDDNGAFLVFDEVITGFGRLGDWFAASHSPVVPDLITFAKGITSGYVPLGGVLVGGNVRNALESEDLVLRHGHTYSGHPVACAAGLEVMKILEREQLFSAAARISDVLGSGLRGLRERGLVQDVRGRGGMWAADVNDGLSHTSVRDRMFEDGVIVRPIGANTIAFCPPLIVSDDQLNECLRAFETAVLGESP